ncbi:MAG: hypothetical protein Q8P18_02630 [Pseudomonadota bacterium]|nr:hypothetical protein [Pseudomonadota bacterium]
MKFMLPVAAGMFVAAGSCCCCGGGDMAEMLEEIEAAQNGAGGTPDIGAADAEEPTEDAPSDAPVTAGGSAEGLCGRFKDDGLQVPSGLSVFSCTSMGTTESVLLRGSGSPADACVSLKSWATGAGWAVLYEADVSGTSSITLKKDSSNLSLACMDVGGTTTVSVSLSPGY